MSKLVLVLNCGSSSVKFAIMNADTGEAALSGIAEGIGSDNSGLKYELDGEKHKVNLPPSCNHRQALDEINAIISQNETLKQSIVAVGHRVVHGGEKFKQAVLVDDDVAKAIDSCSHMAPLHNPANLLGIENAKRAFSSLEHVAVFDTAFFQSMPAHAFIYPLPYSLYEEHGIRRYGFHGTSHQYVSGKAAEWFDKPSAETNLVTAHLGNGCSITAIRGGKAIDTSMGFTPLEGLVMGTRSGDVDPSVILYLQEQLNKPEEEVSKILNKQSGLLGISQLSNDCRALQEAIDEGNELAKLALDIFCYRLAKYIGAYAAIVGKLDALVFTGGIGENSAYVRETAMKHLEHMGFTLSAKLNDEVRFGKAGLINAEGSTPILVMPTNEELVIARETLSCTGQPS